MSFILDALRKSESERQSQEVPTVANSRYHVPVKKTNYWLPVLIVVLGINAVVAAVVLLNRSDDSAPAGTSVSLPSATAPQKQTPRIQTQRLELPATDRTVSPLSREVMADKPPVTTAAAAPDSPPSVAATEKPVPPTTNSLTDGLPTLRQLAVAGAVSVPPLRLDMHVYSPERPGRFVFINMNKYKEGEKLDEGPTVEEITNTGVVLSYQGNRFLLDRE